MSDNGDDIFDENTSQDPEQGSGLQTARQVLSNVSPFSGRERTERERESGQTVRGTQLAQGKEEPNSENLQTLSQRHTEAARQSNKIIDEVIRDLNEGLSQTGKRVQEELNNYEEHAETEVDEQLTWEYDINRSLGEEIEELGVYARQRSDQLEEVHSELVNINSTINNKAEQIQENKSDIRSIESKAEEARINDSLDKKNRTTDSELEQAGIEDREEFAEAVAEATSESYMADVRQLQEENEELSHQVRKLKVQEDNKEDVRDELLEEVTSAYDTHFDEIGEVSQEITSALHEEIGYLEDLAGMELPNLTEEQGVKHVSDAENDLQRSREAAATGVVERINTLYSSLNDIETEADDLVGILPDTYVEDGVFRNYEDRVELIGGMLEEVSGGHDSLEDRVDSLYQEATGESLYEAFDDADATLALERAEYREE